jgi:hypothetical protein
MFEINENKKNKRNTIVYVPFTKKLHDLLKTMEFTTIGIRGFIPTCDFYTKIMRCRLTNGYGIEPLGYDIKDDEPGTILGWDINDVDTKGNDEILPIHSSRVQELYFGSSKERYYLSLNRDLVLDRNLWDLILIKVYKKKVFWNQGRKNKRKIKLIK